MGKQAGQEYLAAIRKRYHLSGKKEKRAILDEFCKLRLRGSMNPLTTSLLEKGALLTLKMHEDKLLSTLITTTPNDFTALYTILHLKIF